MTAPTGCRATPATTTGRRRRRRQRQAGGRRGNDTYAIRDVNTTIVELAGEGSDTAASVGLVDLSLKAVNIEQLVLLA